jgi:hypothetical protein
VRYSKKHVNEIIDQIVYNLLSDEIDTYKIQEAVTLVKEEHKLIDRRTSALPEYASEVVHDFMKRQMAYKELMKKYHCSFRTLNTLLLECAESDPRIYEEMELRRK